ncbi:SMI1/KNR4 family protein [Streptomyces tendae]|uniref:SMI1/KNR4 family protein n=1 Tax=Streptomyces tendae TaxID=1932 RepID=UPI0037A5B75F
MTDDFERRYGFPSGANEVRLADHADHADQAAARTLAQAGPVPADLVTFYDNIGELTWEDVGNGYFIDPAGDALLRFKQYGAVDVSADKPASGLVIGSNGGGPSYVASGGGVIYRTRTASLDEPELDRVADDLRQFLELLERSLTRFVANGEPGCL